MARWTIGILGLTHDHVWTHIQELNHRGDTRVCVAEPNESLLNNVRHDFDLEHTDTDYGALLERESPDAVLVFTDNAGSAALVELAASHGVPVMVEKPMADTLANAERMRVATERAGVPLMVNWPTWWNPAIRQAIRMVERGDIGDLVRFNFRGGHGGPRELGCSEEFCDWLYDPVRNGGGAYIDYCGYGASLARLLLGMPTSVHAFLSRLVKDDIEVDDNAVLTLRYPSALAVIEATWTSVGPIPDAGPSLSGTHGSLVVHGSTGAHPRSVRRISPDRPDGEIIQSMQLPAGERNATEYFLSCLAKDQPFEGQVSPVISRDAQEILEAGLRASVTARAIDLPLNPSLS